MESKQLWQWRGLTSKGNAVNGSLWAESKAAAMQWVMQEGVYPLRIQRCAVKKSHWRVQYSSEIVQQLATLLQAGLTLSEGLLLLAEQHPKPTVAGAATGYRPPVVSGAVALCLAKNSGQKPSLRFTPR